MLHQACARTRCSKRGAPTGVTPPNRNRPRHPHFQAGCGRRGTEIARGGIGTLYFSHIFTHNPHFLAGCGRRCAASGRRHWCSSGGNGRLPAAADARPPPPAAATASDGGRQRGGGVHWQQASEDRGGECTSGSGSDVAAVWGGTSTVVVAGTGARGGSRRQQACQDRGSERAAGSGSDEAAVGGGASATVGDSGRGRYLLCFPRTGFQLYSDRIFFAHPVDAATCTC